MPDSINCFAWLFYVIGRCPYDMKTAESLMRLPPDNQYVYVSLLSPVPY